MEFTRLADVAVVETANDTDKVLIEQNGEIKRMPKTEVGGSGIGNILAITTEDMQSFTANMTLTEALEAFNKHELVYGICYMTQQGTTALMVVTAMGDLTTMLGIECMSIAAGSTDGGQLQLFWTADGISMDPPEGP